MDIYSFINSRDIAAHCRSLAHSYTSVEQAYIIYRSKKLLAQRHAAWQWIIDTQPDTKVIGQAGTKHENVIHESLHQLLKDCMHMENSLDHDNYSLFFYDFQMYIPVPFQMGDILTFDTELFVLTDSEWYHGNERYPEERRYMIGESIMDAIHSYSMYDNGHVYWDFSPATLDVEYYRGELIGMNRVLKTISNYMKGKLSVDLMMNAYHVIMHEEQRDDLRSCMWYTAEGLALAGLEKEGGNEG